ncbi:hypothetical protein D3C76_1657090 [compost metagenome]
MTVSAACSVPESASSCTSIWYSVIRSLKASETGSGLLSGRTGCTALAWDTAAGDLASFGAAAVWAAGLCPLRSQREPPSRMRAARAAEMIMNLNDSGFIL